MNRIPGLQVLGDPLAPIKHVRLAEISDDREVEKETLQKIVDLAMEKGVAIVVARYLDKEEYILPPPR